MNDPFLDLWITRLAKVPSVPVPAVDEGSLATLIDDRNSNVLVSAASLDAGRSQVVDAMRSLAYRDADLDDTGDEATGWLIVDVPIPNQATPEQLVHRMIRRLYFAAVLHGLAEVPVLREAVQSLRMSYLQTRGQVTTSESNTIKGKAEVGLSFDLTKPIKLTASEELTVAESLSAEMQRMNVIEAEDQLVYDLHILLQLNAYITAYADIVGRMLPRWEQVRGFFKACYARLRKKRTIRLRPLFVLEATSAGAAVTVLRLLSKAAAMAAAQGAQLVIIAGPVLVQALDADKKRGNGVFRDQFQRYGGSGELSLDDQALLADVLKRDEGLDPSVAALLRALQPKPKPADGTGA